MKFDRLCLDGEKTVFVLIAISLMVYIWGYHLAKTLLALQILLALYLIFSESKLYIHDFSRIDIAWLSILALYPCSYYLGFFVHERPLDLSRGNDVLFNSLIGITSYLIIRRTDHLTLENFCRYVAISISIAGTVVVWRWAANDFQGRMTIGTNLTLIFACVASAATMMCFWYLTHNKENIWVRMGFLYAGIIGLVSVVAAGARGAWLSIMFLFLLYMFVGLLKKKVVLFIVPVLVAGIFTMWVMKGDVDDNKFRGTVADIEKFIETGEVADSNVSLRLQMWQAAIKVIEERPVLGVGSGTLGDTFSIVGYEKVEGFAFSHAHNDILQAWSALGIPGLLSILALIIIPIWAGVSHKTPVSPYIVVVVLVYVINGITDSHFFHAYSLKYYLLVVGLLLIMHQNKNYEIRLENT